MDKVEIFESTQVAVCVRFLQLMPPNLDQHSFFIQLAEEMDLTFCEQIDDGCPVFVGLWDNVRKTEETLKSYLSSWRQNETSEFSSKANEFSEVAASTDGKSVIVSSEEMPIKTETIVVNQHESDLVNDYGLFITDHPQLFVVTNEVDETYPDFLQCAIPDTKSDFINAEKEASNEIGFNSDSKDSGKVNEIYVDIAVNEKTRKSTKLKSSKQKKKLAEQNPLDKLCKLLCIDEDEAIEKRMTKSEYKRRHENKMPFKYFCQDCSFKTKREAHFKKHLELHEKIKDVLSCDQCDFKTIRESVLCQHKMNHAPAKLTCDVCPFKTNKLARLKYHVYNEHGFHLHKNSANKCHCCDFTASTKMELRRHKYFAHNANDKGEVIWKCAECPYKSNFRAHLKRHQNDVHSGKRPFLCHYCGMRFKRNDTLTQHKITHGEVKKIFECEECGQAFNRLLTYQLHLVTHSDKRPFLCDMCGMSFKSFASTRRHKKTVHLTNEIFPCPHCDRKYKTKAGRDKHKKSHRMVKKEKNVDPVVEYVEETLQDVQEEETYFIEDGPSNVQIVFTGSVLSDEEIVI